MTVKFKDTLTTKAAAEALGKRIADYWVAKGHPAPRMEVIRIGEKTWFLSSDMINGMPQKLQTRFTP